MTWLDAFVTEASSRLGPREREALWARGVTDDQIESFRLGYLNRELPQVDYSASFLEWSHRGAKLDDVFVLPLTNCLGEIKGLQFRHVERERAGYMDFIVDEGEAVLFGLGQAMPYVWETREVFLVEGAFDLFPIQRFFPGVVATLTAHVVSSFLHVLRRLVDEIWLGYDMDKAGRTACAKFLKQYGQEFKVHVVSYPRVIRPGGGVVKDPGELWEAWGDIQYASFIRSLTGRGSKFNAS